MALFQILLLALVAMFLPALCVMDVSHFQIHTSGWVFNTSDWVTTPDCKSLLHCSVLCQRNSTCDAYLFDPDTRDCHKSVSIPGHYQPQDAIPEQEDTIWVKSALKGTDSFVDHFVLLGPGDAYGEYLTEDIVGRPVTTFPSNPLEHVSMATYNSVDGFIVCGQDCFSWKEPAPSWSQMTTVSLPYLAIAVTQINLSDGRIWIVGGRKTSGSYAGTSTTALYDDGQFSLGPELFVPGMNWGLVQISEDEVLAFNGYHNGVTSNTGIYNFQIDSWTDVGPTPASTYHNRGVLIKGSNGEDIVIITVGGGCCSTSLWTYTLSTQAWAVLSNKAPVKLGNPHLIRTNDNKILVLGGFTDEYSPMNTVYLYDHNAVPPTWEIKVENPEPSENLSGGAPILLRAPTKKFWREAP